MAKRKKFRAREYCREQCEIYRRHLVVRGIVPEAEIDAGWPSSKANTEEWIRWYGQMRAWVWIQDDVPGRWEDAEERMLRAIREEPEAVTLLDGNERTVYPKGLHCLMWFRGQDWLVTWLGARVETIRHLMDAGELDRDQLDDPVSSIRKAEAELSTQLAALCYVACSPGPGMPDDPLDPPKWARDLHPVDTLLINRKFVETNAARMEALERLAPLQSKGGEGGGRMSWNVFLGSMATRLKVPPESLAKDRSLVSLLAQARLSTPEMPEELGGDG